MLSIRKILFVSALLLLMSANAGLAQNPSGYHLIKKTVIGGDGGWDYLTLDAAARRLYIARSSRVEVFSLDSNKVIGTVANLSGTHGVATAFGKGFVTNGKKNTAVVFDLKTFAVLAEIKTGEKPDAIIYDTVSARIFTFNGKSNNATAIDAATNAVVGTVELGGGPEFAVADGNGKIFVNIEDKNEIVCFDARTLKVERRFSLGAGEEPTGLAMDRKNRRLFSGCHNKLLIVTNADNGMVVASMPIRAGVDAAAYDADAGLAFSSNGEGTVTVIKQESADKYSVVENVATAKGARTMAFDAVTHHLYLVTAQFGATPASTPQEPNPRPAMLPDTFTVLEFGK